MSKGYQHRVIDSWHFANLTKDNATNQAADEIIENPEKHLLTQTEIFEAEGGVMGLGSQVGAILVGHSLLFAVRPELLAYLRRAQLRPFEWLLVGGVTLGSYYVGHELGARFFGNKQKL